MELAANLPFSLHPREVVFADAKRWQRALSFSVALHALVVGAMLQQHLFPQDAPALLPALSVLIPKLAPASTAVPAATAERPQPIPEYREPRARPPVPTADVLRAAADSSFTAPTARVAPANDAALPEIPANAVATFPPAPPRDRQVTTDPAALAGYNRALSAAVDRYKRYPRIALMRQWQGTVVLQLNIGADGQIQDYHLARSSGHEALDQQALEMLRAAMPLPAAPAQLAGMDLAIDIPVIFRIAD